MFRNKVCNKTKNEEKERTKEGMHKERNYSNDKINVFK
jgi:hypothetical protein